MSLIQQLRDKKKLLKETDTVVTCADGRRFVENKNTSKELAQTSFGFVVDDKPDNVPAKITNNIFLGSQDCCELDVLVNYNITRVLGVGVQPSCVSSDDVMYKFVPCLDLPETDIEKILINDCIPFINQAIKNNCNILVHCNAGVSRSSAIVIGFLIVVDKLTYNQAFEIVKNARNCIKPNAGFECRLRKINRPTP